MELGCYRRQWLVYACRFSGAGLDLFFHAELADLYLGEGMGPKHFQQLTRFHSVLKPLLINKEERYLSTALDKGYFDQIPTISIIS